MLFPLYLTWPQCFALLWFFFLLFYRSCCKSPLDCIHCQRQGPERPLIRPLEPRWASPLPLLKKVFNLTPARQSRQQTKTSSGPVRMTAGTRGRRFLHFRVLKIEFPGVLQLTPVTKTSWKNWKNYRDEQDDRPPPATDTHMTNFCTDRVCVVLCWLVRLIQAQSSPINLGKRQTDHQRGP